jgi:hypothetical protein
MPSVFVLTGCLTIDRGSDSNDFLELTRNEYPKAPHHTGNDQAVRNVRACSLGETVIVGHGKPGILLTNGEQGPGPSGEFIDVRTDLSALRGAGVLRLVGCKTGAGDEGAALLNAIVQQTSARVLAPTGDVRFGVPAPNEEGLFLEPGARWNEATPSDPAESVPAPPAFVPAPTDSIRLVFPGDAVPRTLSVSVITRIDVTWDSGDAPPIRFSWDGDTVRPALAPFDLGKPDTFGPAAAILTGEITLHIKQGESPIERRSFLIYNDNLLMDRLFPAQHYRANLRALRAL